MDMDCKVLSLFNWLMDFKDNSMQLSCLLGLKVHCCYSFIKLGMMLLPPTVYIGSNHHELVSMSD